jgi:N6-adenosine-specific RNA methylase IME4
MTLDEICGIDIPGWGHPDGYYAWIWITWPKLRDGYLQRVLDAWKLKWRSELTWDKEKFGMGFHLRKQTEVLVFATSRDGLRLNTKNTRDILRVKQTGKHSAKPTEARALIENNCPGPYLELFGREHVDGWDVVGHEAPDASSPQPAAAWDEIDKWAHVTASRKIAWSEENDKPCDLDAEFLRALYDEQGGKCALTGETVTFGSHLAGSHVELDRVVPRFNVQITTRAANATKGSGTIGEFHDRFRA